jgi:hypothetical protein
MSSTRRFSMRMKVAVGAIAAALLIVPATAAPAAQAATVNWQIALTPSAAYPAARGSAQYQAQGAQRQFQAEVEHIKSLAGSKVTVKVDGSVVGRPTVSALGRAQASSRVVITSAAGVRIVSGTF